MRGLDTMSKLPTSPRRPCLAILRESPVSGTAAARAWRPKPEAAGFGAGYVVAEAERALLCQ
jgi:hypothetical protein